MQLHHIVYTGISACVYIPIGGLIRLSWGRPTSVVITWSHKRPLHSGRYNNTASHTNLHRNIHVVALFSGRNCMQKNFVCTKVRNLDKNLVQLYPEDKDMLVLHLEGSKQKYNTTTFSVLCVSACVTSTRRCTLTLSISVLSHLTAVCQFVFTYGSSKIILYSVGHLQKRT